VQKPNGQILYIRCGFLQVALQEDIEILNRSLFLASLSTLMAVPLGAYLIALRATRPIAHLITTTAQLQPSNLNERLPIRGTNDEIDQLSHTINGMLDRLALFIDQNRDFVANAAHELRSPLAAIRTSVEVGLNQSRTPEEYALILTDVMEEIARLAGLVNRLLILAEADAGRLGGREQTTRLDKVIREAVDMFEPVAEAKGVRLSIGALAPALVPGDETSVRQIVRNLIDNAIKYNRDQGVVVVHLRLDANKKSAFLIVSDTGIGVQRDELPRLFERFYRADKARSREKEPTGYGLGLSICQTIVQALKGEITVVSETGVGSTFTVRLPLADEATHVGDKHFPLAAGIRA
jgi:signal transduction histidine kinase